MENKEKIAIDIVLLLPPEIVEKCILVNSQLDNFNYVSFSNGYNPHITLGMGCINPEDLEILKSKIQTISQNIKSLELAISGFVGKEFFSFGVEKNQELTKLHFSVMEILENISVYGEAKPEMFYESEKVVNDIGLVDWVSNFNTKHAGDKYDPHISLGKGKKKNIDFPIEFVTQKIAIFHLGSYGSCKNKLVEYILK